MAKDRLLWEVQTLAANVSDSQLSDVRRLLGGMLGEDIAAEIIAQWEHELDEEDD